MAPTERISADQLADAMRTFRDSLVAHTDVINRLNVYPVPDGDTGSNMSATVESVVDQLPDDDNADGVADAISRGSLLGARGNSGVILSQILRGFTDIAREYPEMGGTELAEALTSASDAAYDAVLKPVEGTVLTVIREAAAAAQDVASDGGSVTDVVAAATTRAQEALAETPEQLDALKQAGVVDAGGKGLTLFFDSLMHIVRGDPMPEPDDVIPATTDVIPAKAGIQETEHSGEYDESFQFEVMFLLEDARDAEISAFKLAWAALGDSIVVVGGEGLYNCHVHTNDIGGAIESSLTVGRPRNIRVTDLHQQVAHHHGSLGTDGIAVIDYAGTDETSGSLLDGPVATAVVAVATGEGITKLLRSFGVQSVVSGGQSMNPSTAQLLAAVELAPGNDVIILPNNKNIVLTAQQVDQLTEKNVYVVPTKSVPESFGALFAYDANATIDANANAMTEGAAGVVAGEITRAVRDTESDVGPVKNGEFIGLCAHGLVAHGDSLDATTLDLLRQMVLPTHEVVTLLVGEDADAIAASRIADVVGAEFPQLTLEIHDGGQPLYPLLIGVE